MQKQQPGIYQKSLVGFLYFVQGIFLALPSTSTLVYKKIPAYTILGLFSMALLPFSLKFISAPLIQKYTIQSYGRRKTWLVISQIMASILIIVATNFTSEQEQTQKIFALFLMLVVFMISLQDICTDALAVKQLNSAEMASYMQCMFQPIGWILGSLVYLQLVSGSLPAKLGFSGPILTVSGFFYLLAGITIAASIVIHFTYKEKVLKQEKDMADHSLWEVVRHYKYFINPRFRLCRQGILFLLYAHGITYFNASFTVQLIKNGIITKDMLATFQNIMVIIPVFFLNNLLRKYWSNMQYVHKRTRILLAIRLSIMLILFFSQPKSLLLIFFPLSLLSLLWSSQFFLNSMICNNFTQSKFTGMYVTMMASFTNFGVNSTVQLEIIGLVGYWKAVLFGFCYSVVLVACFGGLERWVKRGLKEGIEGENEKIVEKEGTEEVKVVKGE